jgi:hypothetical protein
VNRTKASVLALFVGYWIIVVVLLVAARAVYDRLLAQVVTLSGNPQPAEIGTLLALTVLLSILSIGVIRGWRWTFWLILVVFLFGVVRVPTAGLQLAGVMPHQDPDWYVVLQAVVGLLQFVIALGMLAGYRRAGVWGAF